MFKSSTYYKFVNTVVLLGTTGLGIGYGGYLAVNHIKHPRPCKNSVKVLARAGDEKQCGVNMTMHTQIANGDVVVYCLCPNTQYEQK